MSALLHGADAPVFRFLRAISWRPLVVAAVNGLAVGVGTTMLLHCDLVYAARSATSPRPSSIWRWCLEAASPLLLPRASGTRRRPSCFCSHQADAAGAEMAGLVSAVFDDAALLAEATSRARALAAKAPNAVRLTKALMKRQPEPVARAWPRRRATSAPSCLARGSRSDHRLPAEAPAGLLLFLAPAYRCVAGTLAGAAAAGSRSRRREAASSPASSRIG